LHVTRPLGGDDRARHVLPALESVSHFPAILGGGAPMPPWTKVWGDGTISGKEALGVPGGFEALHPPLALAGRLMRRASKIWG